MTYHVVIELMPYDCMEHKVKDTVFSTYEDAKLFYKNWLEDVEKMKNELSEEFCCPDSVYNNGSTLMLSGSVAIYESDMDIESDVKSGRICGYEHDSWFHDYLDLYFDKKSVMFVEYLCSHESTKRRFYRELNITIDEDSIYRS